MPTNKTNDVSCFTFAITSFLFGISAADGHVHAKEIETIKIIANYLGISLNDFESIKAMFVSDKISAYKILEVDPKATNDEIKKATEKW